MLKDNRGITLVSILIMVIVLIIIASIAITNGSKTIEDAQGTKREENLAAVKAAVTAYSTKAATAGVFTPANATKYGNKMQISDIVLTPDLGIDEEVDLEDWYVIRKDDLEGFGVEYIDDAFAVNYETNEVYYLEDFVAEGIEKYTYAIGNWYDAPEVPGKGVNKQFKWEIYTPAQLKFLEVFVNNGNKLENTEDTKLDLTELVINAGYNTEDVTMDENTEVRLMRNLDLGARAGSGSTEEAKWETTANEALKWTPIGIDKSTKKFIGTFDGNNHTIRGVYVNREAKFNGIFGNSNTIQNLTIANSYIKGLNCTAGIVGALRSGEIKNCHNKKTTAILMEGSNYTVGGVVGQADGNAINCTNTGTVIGYGVSASSGATQAGGIIGIAPDGQRLVKDCVNYGTVTAIGGKVGGVVGNAGNNKTITSCSNSGAITGNGDRVGGIAGELGPNGTMTSCSNSGAVTGNGSCVGGIAGIIFGTVEKCVNKGTVTQKGGDGSLGGIVGETGINCTAKILNCCNFGTVVEEGSTIVGVGGVVGYISSTGAQGEIKNNYSAGNILIKGSNVTQVGGAIGRYATNTFTIDHNYYETGKSNVTLSDSTSGGQEGLSASEMKSQSLVDKLNSDQTPAVWKKDSSNNGYPSLIQTQD